MGAGVQLALPSLLSSFVSLRMGQVRLAGTACVLPNRFPAVAHIWGVGGFWVFPVLWCSLSA